MVRHVRTTVNIDDHLLAEAKQLAARSHRPLGEILNDALRVLLVERPPRGRRGRVRLPVDGGSGLQRGVDLDDREAMAELVGENRMPPDVAG